MAHAYLSHRCHGCINLFAKFQCTRPHWRVRVCKRDSEYMDDERVQIQCTDCCQTVYLINFAFDICQHPLKLCVQHRFFFSSSMLFIFVAFTYIRAYACNLVQHHVMHFILSNISIAFPYCFCFSSIILLICIQIGNVGCTKINYTVPNRLWLEMYPHS